MEKQRPRGMSRSFSSLHNLLLDNSQDSLWSVILKQHHLHGAKDQRTTAVTQYINIFLWKTNCIKSVMQKLN